MSYLAVMPKCLAKHSFYVSHDGNFLLRAQRMADLTRSWTSLKSQTTKPCEVKGKVCPNFNWTIHASALISGFCSLKRLGVFLLPPDGILVHRRLPPDILSGCIQSNLLVPIYTPEWKGAVRVKCFALEHNADAARARTLDLRTQFRRG